MLPHEKAQKHSDDYHKTLKETCVVGKDGFVFRFNGKPFWDAFKSLGHDTTDIKTCKCGSGEHYRTPPKVA